MTYFASDARSASYTGVRPEILERVGLDRSRVLDVGCATGTLGAALKRREDTHVVGIELNEVAADEARRRIDEVITGDIDDWDSIAGRLPQEPFDCIICADVLEHTRDPWGTLSKLAGLLTPGGRIIISLPNVGHVNTLLNVFVLRRFPRRDRGIHDDTHLRWFARKDVRDLARGAGMTIVERVRTARRSERSPSDDAVATAAW
jgi:methionine biosynthesis protein MetW